MGALFEKLKQDVRFIEGLNACINCGTCTAICPAAEFYKYDPRTIAVAVLSKDDDVILDLLKSETIWYCGECMSCATRCPRGNTPGLIIIALRSLSQDLGYFVESEKGRQQLAIKRTIGEWTVKHGYCVVIKNIDTDLHPEQGPIWDWKKKHLNDVMNRLGANYEKQGPGILRKIPEESLNEIKSIFDVTGGTKRFETIEQASKKKAEELGLSFDDTNQNEYYKHIYTNNSNNHNK